MFRGGVCHGEKHEDTREERDDPQKTKAKVGKPQDIAPNVDSLVVHALDPAVVNVAFWSSMLILTRSMCMFRKRRS